MVYLLKEASGILFFTDFHAHLFSEFAKPSTHYYTDRFETQMKVLQGILETAVTKHYGIVFGGDLFHKRTAVDIRVFNAVYLMFAKYSNDIPFTYLLRGNHDSFDNSMGSDSSLDTFQTLPNVEVISTPTVSEVTLQGVNEKLYFMPYGEEIDDMKATLAKFGEEAKGQKSVLIAHLGIDGASQGMSNHRLASAFTVDDLHSESYDLVYLGHFHARQTLISEPTRVFYGGSTMQLTFNDEGQEKGYDLYDGTELTFVPVETPKFMTFNHWGEDTQEAIDAGNYIRLQLPEKDAKRITLEAKQEESQMLDNIRVEAQANFEVETRLDIKADNTPVQVTDTYTKTYYPAYHDEAINIIKGVLD